MSSSQPQRTLAIALLSLAAALLLAACGGGSESGSSAAPGGEKSAEPGIGEALVEAISEAGESGVPVRIPPSLAKRPPGGAEQPTVLRSPPDSYTLGLSKIQNCQLKSACTAAIFSGFSGGGELTGARVSLAHGIAGVYEPGRCGPGCSFATVEWRQQGNRYGVGVAKASKAELVALANEAITAPPLSGSAIGSGAEPRAGASSAQATVRLHRATAARGREPGSPGGPAAGVCPRARAAVVTVELFSDVPSPRCVAIDANQRLRFVNRTGEGGQMARPVKLDFAGFEATIVPGQAALLDEAVGGYLGSGVHDVTVEGAPGPELWLKPAAG